MKRVVVFGTIVVLAMVLAGGCATIKDWVCANRVTIGDTVATAQATVDAIDAGFPGLIPPEYQAAKAAAYTVIAIGKNILDTKVCPTVEDVSTVNTEQAVMNTTMKTAAKISAARAMSKQGK